MGKSAIEWTEDVWNPTVGCSRVSPGCDRCYAMTQAPRQAGRGLYEGVVADGDWTGRVNVTDDPKLLYRPIRQTRGRRIFVNSMSDLFHEAVPAGSIAHLFAVMAMAPHHQFQILTKRHKRMRDVVSAATFQDEVNAHIEAIRYDQPGGHLWYRRLPVDGWGARQPKWPLPNVWLGVSVEAVGYLFRVRYLLETPAAVRFVSAEPLIKGLGHEFGGILAEGVPSAPDARVSWVIVGGESGHGARPMHPEWARTIRDQCDKAGVPFLFKQWGNWRPGPCTVPATHLPSNHGHFCADGKFLSRTEAPETREFIAMVGKHEAGRELDGRLHDGYPA